MRDDIALKRLANVPAEIRNSLMRTRPDLPNGAITVIQRFFETLTEQGEHISSPSGSAFEQCCGSEATLGLLLRVLETHAPQVNLAAGRDLRRTHYRRRPGGSEHPARRCKSVNSAGTNPRGWPQAWLDLLPGLRAAPIADTSINRYIASVNRCADLLPGLVCPPRPGWLLAWEIAEALHRADVRDITAAGYIAGLVSLGAHGGLEPEALGGLRSIVEELKRKARRVPKMKATRIEGLYAKGGYAEVLRNIQRVLDIADGLPSWRAEAEIARAAAAVLAVTVNVPARTGDVASWVLGEHLVRQPSGDWQLRWRQGKTGHWLNAGTLWPLIGMVVDEHILGGRPKHQAHQRYAQLCGMNWLSLRSEGYASRWPSEKCSESLGVPIHDLRTLAADYLRLHDPEAAPEILGALLGHRTRSAGEEYRALCTETAAQRDWSKIREQIVATAKVKR